MSFFEVEKCGDIDQYHHAFLTKKNTVTSNCEFSSFIDQVAASLEFKTYPFLTRDTVTRPLLLFFLKTSTFLSPCHDVTTSPPNLRNGLNVRPKTKPK